MKERLRPVQKKGNGSMPVIVTAGFIFVAAVPVTAGLLSYFLLR